MNIKKIVKWILVIASIGIVYPPCCSIFTEAVHHLETFFHTHGDYDQLRRTFPIFDSALEAKGMIPADAAIDFSPAQWNLYRVSARYSLYPHETSKNWRYFIDFSKNFNPDPGWKSYILSTGVLVFAKAGNEIQRNKSSLPPTYPTAQNFFIFMFMVIYQCWLGSYVLKWLKISRSENPCWYWGTSYLLGFLVLTLLLWIFLLVGGEMTKESMTVLCVIVGFLFKILAAKPSCPTRTSVFIKDPPNSLTRALQIFSILIIAAIFASAVFNVVNDWDAMSNWIMKAKVMHYHKRLDFAYTHHNYYPILWPLNIALQFTFADGFYDEMAQWTSGLFFLLIVIQLKYGLACLRTSVKVQWFTIFLYLVFSQYLIDFTTANAENIFVAFLFLLIILLIKWLEDSSNAYWQRGIVLAATGLVLIKLEGTVAILLIIFTLLSLYQKFPFKKDLGGCVLGIAITLPLGFLWTFWIKYHGYLNGIVHLQEGLSWNKLCTILKFDFLVFLRSPLCIILLFAVLYFILYPNRRRFNLVELFLLRLSILLMCFSAFAYFGLPAEQIEGAFHHAFPRLFMHAAPPLVLLWASRAGVANLEC